MVYSFCTRLKVSGEKLHGFLECPLYSLQITLWNVVAYYMATCERYSANERSACSVIKPRYIAHQGSGLRWLVWEIKEFHYGIFFEFYDEF